MSTISRTGSTRTTTRELLTMLLDGEPTGWDPPAGAPPPESRSADYLQALAAARARTGLDESVTTGEGRLGGHRIAVVAGEFGFLAGSIGAVAATRIVDAVERATRERLPLLGITASGGTRMQEGTPAFARMAGIASAIHDHKRAGLPYLTYLRHPTTGGVLASWGSLGDITFAEPGALVGFLGPRVYAALHGEEFPAGVQTAEHLQEHGLVDVVVPHAELRGLLVRVLDLVALARRPPAPSPARAGGISAPAPDAWTAVSTTRATTRPGLRDLLEHAAECIPLTRSAPHSPAPGALLALARFGCSPCVVVGHDRSDPAPPGPAALRLARRAMGLAAALRMPLVTVIDTAGSELSARAEEQGTAREIASCLVEMASVETPTVAVLLGRGAGGGALALLPADRVLAAGHAWLAPLPPEGASVILHGTPARAAEVIERQAVRAPDLLRHGIVDALIDERPDAMRERDPFPARTAAAIEHQLRSACNEPATVRSERRRRRWRALPA